MSKLVAFLLGGIKVFLDDVRKEPVKGDRQGREVVDGGKGLRRRQRKQDKWKK